MSQSLLLFPIEQSCSYSKVERFAVQNHAYALEPIHDRNLNVHVRLIYAPDLRTLFVWMQYKVTLTHIISLRPSSHCAGVNLKTQQSPVILDWL